MPKKTLNTFISGGDSIEVIRKEVMRCRQCKDLVESRNKIALSNGTGKNGIMIIGEAPSQIGGNLTGLSWSAGTSKSGVLLHRIFDENNMDINDCYLTNVCLCSPPNNRSPTKKEISNCIEYTKREIMILKPKIVILIGGVAGRCFLPEGYERGRIYNLKGISYISFYHPAYILRQNDGYLVVQYKATFSLLLK